MKVHELKTWPSFFHDVVIGQKTFEFRKNDRDFKEGDILFLKEYDPNRSEYLGGETLVIVARIYDSTGKFGIPDGYVIMEIKRLKVE